MLPGTHRKIRGGRRGFMLGLGRCTILAQPMRMGERNGG
jgi:hypothetical protein